MEVESPETPVMSTMVAEAIDKMQEVYSELAEAREAYDIAKEEAASRKRILELVDARARAAGQDVIDAKAGRLQPRLPFVDDSVDPSTGFGIDALEPYGITTKTTEILAEHDIKTIGQLEKTMRENDQWHRGMKGFGDERLNKLIDAYTKFRQENPHPEPVDSEEVDG